jgi:signal transduction histidine kinase
MSRLTEAAANAGRSRTKFAMTPLLMAALVAGALPLVAAAAATSGDPVPDAAAASRSAEEGRPFQTCFDAKEYGAAAQSWVFAQSDHGVMYAGNNLGVLEYDGTAWRLIGPRRNTRAIAKDARGRLYVGTVGDFGYLAPDEHGSLQYVSLLQHVKPEDRAFNDVWTAHATPDGIYFQARERLFRVTPPSGTGDSLHVRTWNARTPFLYAFWIDGAYYVHQQDVGLQRMVGDDLRVLPGGEQFGQERLQVLLPLGDARGSDLLAGTFNRGFFRFDGQRFQPFPTEVDGYLREHTLYRAVSLASGALALTTLDGGLIVIDRNGHPIRFINTSTGLPNNNALAAYVDLSGGLWAAVENAICQIEIPSPLSRFDANMGLVGAPIDIIRHDGVLYVGTGAGVFYLDPATSAFKKVTGARAGNVQVLALASDGKRLLAAYGSGLHQIEGGSARLIKPNIAASFASYVIRFSKQDPHRIWFGLESGLASMRVEDSGRWVDEGPVAGIHDTVSVLVEPTPGELWLGTSASRVLRVRFAAATPDRPQIERFGEEAGLTGDLLGIFAIHGRPVIATKQGTFAFDDANGRFVADPTWAGVSIGGTQDQAAMTEDAGGSVWVNFGLESAVFRRQPDRTYRLDKTALLRLSGLPVSRIYVESDGVAWFAGDDGVVRYDSALAKTYTGEYTALIRRVTEADGRLLFGGARADGQQPVPPRLPHADNALRFEFAAPSFIDVRATRYASWLEGFDARYSVWSADAKRDYTNLPPGSYTFHVKARNLYQHESREAIYSFTIVRPWYATWWAYLLYALGGIALVGGFVGIRTRKLKADRNRLEQVVADRTREIRERESEVRTQADELRRLDEIVKTINREEGLRNVLHALLEEGLKLVPQAEKGTCLVRDLKTGDFRFAAQVGYDTGQLQGISLSERDITERYAQGTERVEQGVYIVRPAANGGGKGPLGDLPVPKAMLAMTVALQHRLEALLVFDNMDDENAFNSSDLQRLARLREHAIGAVTKARSLVALQEKTAALEQQKEAIEQAYDNVELLSRIGRDITAKLSIVDIIETVYENVNSLMDAAVFGIALHDEAGGRLEFPAMKENGQRLPPFSYGLDDPERLAVICFRNRQEIVVEDMTREYRKFMRTHKPPVAGDPVASILYLPLVYKDRTIGVITAQSFRKHAYTDYHLNILRNLATYATIALVNADAYRRLNDTLDRLKSTQEQLVIQEKLASLGALTAGIAHEIKNPLNFVNNFADLSVELAGELRESIEAQKERLAPADFDTLMELTADLVVNAKKINEHGRRADSIVRGMLLHSRGHSGERQQTDVNALLEEYVNLSYHGMRAQDSSFNITIERNYDPAAGQILAVPQDLSRVFLNIVNNACYATQDRKVRMERAGKTAYAPTLTVRTKDLGDRVEIRIRDNGDGIPAEIRDRIFNPFFTTKPTGQGTGLGLSISHDIVVQQHDGELEVDSKPGEYTEFVLRLPRAAAGAVPASVGA